MINPMDLTGRNILITGAAQGIGEAVARLAHELGAHVVLNDLQGDKLKSIADDLGSRVDVCAGSVSDYEFVQGMVSDAVARNGALHGLVNNAGIVRAAMAKNMTPETWQSVIDINLTGVFYCLQAVGQHMLERIEAGDTSPASIVNISSDAGRRGTIGQINYGAAKSGVMGLTMSSAREWSQFGIRINSVLFGVVETPMTEVIRSDKFRDGVMAQVPMKRFSTAAEVSQPVCFLLSEGASYMTGQHVSVNGGYTIGV
ncbi:SDR family NAD(P)-dependent oxidoreductase [Labrenzia sp. PHM005]|uniref:SDR family NAD(P)-dependent oxidoreductase n=1 Tax=Labrenzia sp. PHM005 TaxID=2590016 RepID=UPI0011402243|nr:SDR family NAD(P)-dependent oxidoreductase [Labrenzia sp. PHM005]QDG78843.1 SDR family oxidoreductase [Labrenzia sp. PHM005]